MKKIIKIFTLITIVSMTAASAAYSGCWGGCRGLQGGGSGPVGNAVSSLPYVMPDEDETAGLVKMREEEKLARDVYATLSEKWDNDVVFVQISMSEQRHMDSIKSLLDKYGIADPVVDDMRGVFQSEEFQKLYNTLVARGSTSLEDAMQVGATIEDLDIYDLNKLIASTDNEDILVVYQNLAKGSRNHLRRFATELTAMDIPYSAQYLTQKEVDSIIYSNFERGPYDKDGQPMFSAPGGKGGSRGMGFNSRGCGGRNFVDENGNGVCDWME